MDSGFKGETKIQLKNKAYKEIKEIEVGDILSNGERVYGIVKINGNNLHEQFKYNLGNKISAYATLDLEQGNDAYNFRGIGGSLGAIYSW